jgi:hypothetical protein
MWRYLLYAASVHTMRMKGKTRQAEAMRRQYWDRVNNERCYKCGRKRGKKRVDRTTCQACAKKESARVTASYFKRRAEQ